MKKIPSFTSRLRKNIVSVPDIIDTCSGIRVFGQLLKSFLFSTDVAIIRNTNANAIIAVYPFTPQPLISHSLILAADKPIFCGVGGGITTGDRSIELAIDAEFQGALGVVLNKPCTNDMIKILKEMMFNMINFSKKVPMTEKKFVHSFVLRKVGVALKLN